MAGSVMIKGTKNGITLVLDENEEYDVLKEKVEKKTVLVHRLKSI